jgi:hypothetical protein
MFSNRIKAASFGIGNFISGFSFPNHFHNGSHSGNIPFLEAVTIGHGDNHILGVQIQVLPILEAVTIFVLCKQVH